MSAEAYALNWAAIVLAAIVGVGAMAAMMVASKVLAPRHASEQKDIPYESGILPTPLNWTQLTVRYYIFAILFLLFDVEAVFLFPWAVVFLQTASYVFYAMLIFIGVLLFGVAYAWRKGVLQWR
ncbi:MAG: NADH-quinone oxidoreductase subunit A [Dehalococcoidia bacterium]